MSHRKKQTGEKKYQSVHKFPGNYSQMIGPSTEPEPGPQKMM